MEEPTVAAVDGSWSTFVDWSNSHQDDASHELYGVMQSTPVFPQQWPYPGAFQDFQQYPKAAPSRTANQLQALVWRYVSQLECNLTSLQQQLEMLRSQVHSDPTGRDSRSSLDASLDDSSPSRCGSSTEDNVPDTPSGNCPSNSPRRRKYTRRPKPDTHAPTRPLTAYARFACDVRERYSSQGLSFSGIAKRTGVDWQSLPHRVRDSYMNLAAVEKTAYDQKMDSYKKTDGYARYQEYLVSFKSKPQQKPSIPRLDRCDTS